MRFLERIDHHSALFARMAQTVRADLDKALGRGQLDGSQLRGAVLRCTTCSDVEACRGWLAAKSAGAVAPPEYCRNRQLLTRLTR